MRVRSYYSSNGVLMGRDKSVSLCPKTHTEERPCEDTAGRQLLVCQEKDPHQKPSWPAP